MYVHIRRGKKYKNMPKTKNGNKKYNKKKKKKKWHGYYDLHLCQ